MPFKGFSIKHLPSIAADRLAQLPSDCRGYLDPGSGSYLLQVAMAGLLGAAFTLKSFWGNLKTTLRAKLDKHK